MIGKEEKTVVFPYGACSDNGQSNASLRAAIGVYWDAKSKDNLSTLIPSTAPQTNGYAELLAAIEVIDVAIRNKVNEIIVKSDSRYVVQGVSKWIEGWVKKKWIKADKTEVKHQELWKKYLEQKKNIKINWVHVLKGTEDGNMKSDILARSALDADLSKEEVDILNKLLPTSKKVRNLHRMVILVF